MNKLKSNESNLLGKTFKRVRADAFHTCGETSSGHTCGVTISGSVACWGFNREGQTNPPSLNEPAP